MTAIGSQKVEKDKLLIIGDLLIDKSYFVNVPKISPEAPVPVASLIDKESIDTPGGAGLGAAFAAKEDINTIFATYCSVGIGQWLKNEFRIKKIIGEEQDATNISKTRYIDTESGYHLLRVDNDNTVEIPLEEDSKNWLGNIKRILKSGNISIVLMLDYRKGVLGPFERVQSIISEAQKNRIPVYVDSRSNNLEKFSGVNIIKLNKNEYKSVCKSFGCFNIAELMSLLDTKTIIVTKGHEGAELNHYSESDGKMIKYLCKCPDYPGQPDVTGCGDVFDVTFCKNWGINKEEMENSLIKAVERATKFAYEPIKERIKWH